MFRFLRTGLGAFGLRQLARGARVGSGPSTGLGLAAMVYAFFRSRRLPDRELLWSGKVKPGRAVKIRVVQEDGTIDEAVV